MDVRDSVLSCIREYGMLSGADRVVCALSGGADSVCLADVLLSLAQELGFRLECAHYNHLLRGEESDRDAAFAAAWCADRGLTLHAGSGDVSAYASQHHLGVEEAARHLRYAFLDGLGDERTRIATAHQAGPEGKPSSQWIIENPYDFKIVRRMFEKIYYFIETLAEKHPNEVMSAYSVRLINEVLAEMRACFYRENTAAFLRLID